MRQYSKLNLRIIGIHEQVIIACNKYLADSSAHFHPDRDILKIWLSAANPSGNGDSLVKA